MALENTTVNQQKAQSMTKPLGSSKPSANMLTYPFSITLIWPSRFLPNSLISDT
ncbi:MAG TPA: hypothetical protein VLM20_00375 [Methylophilaceae bacterium]|nr:hypothetical protein [Methylophilaceae bacterium]